MTALAYRTVRTHDTLYLDQHGRPTRQVTVHCIEALQDLASVPYTIHTRHVAQVVEISGCKVGNLSTLGTDRHRCEILPYGGLNRGERAAMVYEIRFNYPTAPYPVLRRHTGHYGIEEIEMAVVFAPYCAPKQVWWTEWESAMNATSVIPDETVPLALSSIDYGREGSIARYRNTLLPARRLLGLYWMW